MMNDYLLKLKDGTEIRVPGKDVAWVNTQMAAKLPIPTKNRTILYAEIEKFEDWTATKTKGEDLKDAAAAAFGQPIVTERGIKSKWVKKVVSNHQWNTYFAGSPGYVKLRDAEQGVEVAFIMPVHHFKSGNNVVVCDDNETKELERLYYGRT